MTKSIQVGQTNVLLSVLVTTLVEKTRYEKHLLAMPHFRYKRHQVRGVRKPHYSNPECNTGDQFLIRAAAKINWDGYRANAGQWDHRLVVTAVNDRNGDSSFEVSLWWSHYFGLSMTDIQRLGALWRKNRFTQQWELMPSDHQIDELPPDKLSFPDNYRFARRKLRSLDDFPPNTEHVAY